MSDERPSRLPSVYAGVSRCPICGYSLRDLGQDLPCPECGSVIDRDLLTSPELFDAVTNTKVWCCLGAAGWLLSALAWWLSSMAALAVRPFSAAPPTPAERAGVWVSSAVIALPALYLVAWCFGTKRTIYRRSAGMKKCSASTPRGLIAVAVSGSALGCVSFGLLLMLISS